MASRSILHVTTLKQLQKRDHGDLQDLLADDHPQYQKEAEKDVGSGYAALDTDGNLLVKGAHLKIARDASNNIYLTERTSGDTICRFTRIGTAMFEGEICSGGIFYRFETQNFKGVPDGYAALDTMGKVVQDPATRFVRAEGITINTDRLADTVYQNTNPTWILVFAWVGWDGAGGVAVDITAQLKSDASNPPVTVRSKVSHDNTDTAHGVLVTCVPPNHYYLIEMVANATLRHVMEIVPATN